MTRKRIYKMEWRIYLMQEAPSVGIGWRGVAVISEGRKWIYLIEKLLQKSNSSSSRKFGTG